MRRIGLSKRQTPSQSASSQRHSMSLEDESQQPLVAGSSPPAIKRDPMTSADVMRQLASQYPSMTFGPPSDDVEPVAQGYPGGNISFESDASESIPWGSPVKALSLEQAARQEAAPPPLPVVEERPEAEGSDDGMISSPSGSDKAVPEEPGSGRESKASQLSDKVNEPEEPEDISSPGASDGEATATPKRRRPGQSQSQANASRVTPERGLQPITSSLPAVGSQSSPVARVMTTPLKHATNVSPSKIQQHPSQSTPTKSSTAPARLPSPLSSVPRARAVTPESSDNFTRGMIPKEKPQRVLDRLLSSKEVEGTARSRASTQSSSHERAWSSSAGTNAVSANVEPTPEYPPPSSGLVEDVLDEEDANDPGEPTFVNPAEATFVDPGEAAGVLPSDGLTPTAGTRTSPIQSQAESETQLNDAPMTDKTDKTQTQESGSAPLFPTATPPPRGFGNLPSSSSISHARRSPSALFSDAFDDIGGQSESQLLRFNDSFVATQVLPPPAVASADPPQRQSTESVRTNTTNRSSKPLPPHRMLKRHDRGSTSDRSMPPAVRQRTTRSAPQSVYEATFVENTFVDRTQPSTVENKPDTAELGGREGGPDAPNAEEASSSADGLPTGGEPATDRATADNGATAAAEPDTSGALESAVIPAAPPAEDPPIPPAASTPPAEAPPATPPGSINPATDIYNVPDGTIFRPPKPRPSPHKYGRRNRPAAAPVRASDSDSSSVPDDPEDSTFQDEGTQVAPPEPAAKPVSESPHGSPERTSTSIVSSRIPGRGKRKQLSPAAELSGSSSSAPEDEEDYSYRPTLKAQAKAKAEGSAKPPPKKKAKPPAVVKASRTSSSRTPASSRLSTASRSNSVRAASRATSRAPSVRAESVPAPAEPDAEANDEPSPIRVLALWSKTKEYFAGTIVGQNSRGYRIKFDDNCTGTVHADKVRLLRLRPGDRVFDGPDPTEYHVASASNGTDATVDALDVKGRAHRISIVRLVVHPRDIATFADRTVPPASVSALFPLAATSTHLFAGMAFLLTGNDPRLPPDSLRRRIESHGGEILPTWDAPFRIAPDSTYTLLPGRAPFALQLGDRCILTPKVMAALGAGIPLLSAAFVDAAITSGASWHASLISPGESRLLRQPASQLVDPGWGGARWDRTSAVAPRRPLAGKKVLFVEPSVRFARREEISSLVPFCLAALGGVVSRAGTLPAELDEVEVDFAVVEDRDPAMGAKLTRGVRAGGRVGNVAWVKGCLVVGGWVRPEIAEER